MSDRVSGFLVTLERDLRDEDAEAIKTALEMVRHVLSVKALPENGNNWEVMMATDRVRQELSEKLWEVIHPKRGSNG
jgi:hypothetical protein